MIRLLTLAVFGTLAFSAAAKADTRVIIPSENERSVIMINDGYYGGDPFRLFLAMKAPETRKDSILTREFKSEDGKVSIQCNWLLDSGDHACILKVLAGPDSRIDSGDRFISYSVKGDAAAKLLEQFSHWEGPSYNYKTQDGRFSISAEPTSFTLKYARK